jgi:hypothetical protein
MKTTKLISLGKTLAIAILILGIIHVVATFSPLIMGGLGCLSPGDLKAMIYMSLICGSSFIISGAVLLNLLKKVEQYAFLTTSIVMIGVFLGVSGVLSIIYMIDNPFAWMAFLLNLGMFVVTLSLKFKRSQ